MAGWQLKENSMLVLLECSCNHERRCNLPVGGLRNTGTQNALHDIKLFVVANQSISVGGCKLGSLLLAIIDKHVCLGCFDRDGVCEQALLLSDLCLRANFDY